MKVEQATPVRAAALTSDGVWHIGGVFLEASGGGCSSPAMARGDADWTDTLGNAQGRMWRKADGMARAAFSRAPPNGHRSRQRQHARVLHREVRSQRRRQVIRLRALEMFEPVSEDPTVTMELKVPPIDASVHIDGRDNNGTIYRSTVPSALERKRAEPRCERSGRRER